MFFAYEKQAMVHTADVQFESYKERMLHEMSVLLCEIWLGKTSVINGEELYIHEELKTLHMK